MQYALAAQIQSENSPHIAVFQNYSLGLPALIVNEVLVRFK